MSRVIGLFEVEASHCLWLTNPGLSIRGYLDTDSEEPLVLISAFCSFYYQPEKPYGPNTPISPPVALMTDNAAVTKGGRTRVTIPLQFNRPCLDAIEKQRDGKHGVFIGMDVRIIAAQIIGTNKVMGAPESVQVKFERKDLSDYRIELSRDRWIQLLNHFKYKEIENFELPVYRHLVLPGVTNAIKELREAEEALRLGDWLGVLTKTRGAFEALATIVGDTDKTNLGFEHLWSMVFPDERDKPLRDATDELVKKLGELQHLGRHRKPPFPEIQRPEALLAIRQTLALFEYIGQRLGNK